MNWTLHCDSNLIYWNVTLN